MSKPPSGMRCPEYSTVRPPASTGATAGWFLKSSSIWYTGVDDVQRSDSVATTPMDTDERFVYRKPPPTCPCVAAPANSQAAPSPGFAWKRSVTVCSGSSTTSLALTASWCGAGRLASFAFSDSSEFTPSARMVTSAVISSSPARTPTMRPPFHTRSSTAIP